MVWARRVDSLMVSVTYRCSRFSTSAYSPALDGELIRMFKKNVRAVVPWGAGGPLMFLVGSPNFPYPLRFGAGDAWGDAGEGAAAFRGVQEEAHGDKDVHQRYLCWVAKARNHEEGR